MVREASSVFVGIGIVFDLASPPVPQIHAVGRAAAGGREPRLLDLTWTPAGFTGDLPKVGATEAVDGGDRDPSLVIFGRMCWGTCGTVSGAWPDRRMAGRGLRACLKQYAVGRRVQCRTCGRDHHAVVLKSYED